MFTIHDFLGTIIMSSYQHQGYKAHPFCGSWIVNRWSKELGKPIFERCRRWLWRYHPYIFHPNTRHFNGKKELWGKPHTTLVVDIVR